MAALSASVARHILLPLSSRAAMLRPPTPARAAASSVLLRPRASRPLPPPPGATARRSMVVVTQHTPTAEGPPVVAAVADAGSQERSAAPPADADAPLIVTAAAWDRIRRLTARGAADNDDEGPQYLRVYVDAGGCSGFSYVFELSREALDPEEDLVLEGPATVTEDATAAPATPRVVVDRASLELIRGSTLDFVQEMIKSAFEVRDNPQSESACGCGSSFAVKNFAANRAAH